MFKIRREGVHLIDAGKYSFFLDFSKSILEKLETKWELKTAKHFLKHLKAYYDYTQKSLFPAFDYWDPGNVTFEKPPIVYDTTSLECYFMRSVKEEAGPKFMKILLENHCADSSLVAEVFHTSCVRDFYRMCPLFMYKAALMEYILYHWKKEKYPITHLFDGLREEYPYKVLIRTSPKHLLVLLKYGFKFIFKAEWKSLMFLQFYPSDVRQTWQVPAILRRRRTDLNPRETIIFDIFAHFITWSAPQFTAYMECVRNIWRSVPDAFISFDEIRDLLLRNEVTNVEEICDTLRKHEFSSFDTIHQPRCLSHYSRCVIRSALMRNSHLPDGISHLGLPKRLEAYLNLELD
ncbi:uncharacterized protein LOC118199997 [Stegodyphus dumicola]|uniref:uncharacterized protein LOC118199997 n=1 Tax=Stegodyphus dumicola TaxID=202533 RepID=UPI0015B120C1|nr:uncharacterized protein LOC118199997 [Stegodyphus dumicola]